MIQIKQILVPTDFSETSDIALEYAKGLAEKFDASLHLMHVLVEWMPEGYIAFTPEMFHDIEKAAYRELEGTLLPEEREKYKVKVVMERGTSEFVEIVQYAKEQQIDLIVMGTHGRGAIAHMLLGSVAEKVVRKAPCPVLTVRHPEHQFVMP